MISAWWLLPAAWLGVVIGVLVIALCRAAGDADERMGIK